MPQINLLDQESRAGGNTLANAPLYMVRLLVAIFIVLLLYWAFLFVESKLTTGKIAGIQQTIIAKQKQLLENNSRKELILRQGQLASVKTLIASQEKWSKLLPELARVTLQSARYMSFNADGQGNARMVVNVPNYKEMDKFLQVFNLPEFNNEFSQVTVSGVSRVQQGDVPMVRFDVGIKYDKSFLHDNQEGDVSILR
jgi:hypothetical protein